MSLSHRRRLVTFSVVAVLLAAGTAFAYLTYGRRDVTTSSDEARRLYYEGVENLQRMYTREALESFAAALGKDPHFVMATLRLANELYGRDPERAKSLVESAARWKDSLTPRERLYLEMFEARHRGDRKAFEAEADEYLRRFPTDPEGYQIRAAILARAGKQDEAAKVYEQLLAVNPNYAIAYNSLGYHAMGRREWAKAEDAFKRYRFLAPDQANPFDSLGELYANIGRYREARESLKQALAVKPDFAPSIAHLGTVAAGEGNFEEAARQLESASEMTDVPESRLSWGFDATYAFFRAGKPEEGLEELAQLEAAARHLPEKAQKAALARAGLFHAVLLARQGKPAEAERLVDEAVAAFPRPAPDMKEKGEGSADFSQSVALVRAILADARGDHAAAAAGYEAALKGAEERQTGGSFSYFPYTPLFRADEAAQLAALGRREEAEKALAKALAINPKFQPALEAASRLGLEVPGPAAATAQR